MRKRTVLIVLVVLVVGLGATGVAILKSLDLGAYRDVVADEVRAGTGRELTLAGDPELDISLTPALVVEGVALSNAEWSADPEMLRLGRLEVEVALLPLLSGDIQVNRLVLIEPELLLETDVGGRVNWVFGPPGDEGDDTAESGEAALPSIDRLLIRRGTLTYVDRVTEERMTLDIDELEVAAADDDRLDLTGAGRFNDAAYTLAGVVGALDRLTEDGPYPLALEFNAGGASIKVDGTVARPLEGRGLTLALTAGGEDLAALSPIAGTPLPAVGPFSVRGQVDDAEAGYVLSGLAVKLGETDLAGTARIDPTAAPPKLTADLSSTLIDLDALTATVAGQDAAPANPSGRLFSEALLGLDGLAGLDAHIKLSADKILTGGVALEAASAEVALTSGKLSIEPLAARVADGTVTGKVRLDGGTAPRLDVALKVAKVDAGALLQQAGITDLLQGRADLHVDLRGQGASPAALAGSLTGETRFLMGDGRIKSQAIDWAVGGASAAISALVDDDGGWSRLNCVVSDIRFASGIGEHRALLLDTEHATVIGEGTVNLRTETVDMKVTPEPKSATINVMVPVEISGNLADPTVLPDKLATARKVGGLLGVVVFPPAALLALGELGSGEDNPCVRAAAGGGTAMPADEGGVAETAEEVGKSISEGAEEIGDSITKGIKSLFD